jgi:serine/threonine-protein kinase
MPETTSELTPDTGRLDDEGNAPSWSLSQIPCCRDLLECEGPFGPVSQEELSSGYVLDDRFLIRQTIARSAMAIIYRAEDRAEGGKTVAIKVPLLKIESDPISFGRFQREERIGAKLDHPHLLKFIPVSGSKSRPYIVMEYLSGCTLAWVLHRTRVVPERDASRILSLACGAVQHMHDRGFMHRDLKPENIMICRDGSLRIIDFGLSAEIETRRSVLAGLTPLFGTPEYMAPEQVRNKTNDGRTDIYSLGAILFEMLTGVRAFRNEDSWASAQMRVTGDPVAPRSLNAELSPQAEEIVLRAMQRKPSDRYPAASALRADLDAPELVQVTGLSQRLRAPHFRLSLEGTPILAGVIISLSVILVLAAIFFVTLHSSKGR